MSEHRPTSSLHALSEDLATIVERAAPSVVRVDDQTRLTASGIVWDDEGLVIATSHGVEVDEGITIVPGDGTRYEAALLGRDLDRDVAVLRAEGLSAKPLPRTTRALRVGEILVGVARPGDWGLHASLGMVAAGCSLLLPIDISMAPGSSGGAVLDSRGELIGMANLGNWRGAALAVTAIDDSLDAILANGRVPRGYLGVRTQPASLSPAAQQQLGLEQPGALLIVHIESGSPAEAAGLLLGDLLLELEDTLLEDPRTMRSLLRSRKPGESVRLKLLRGGEALHLAVELGPQP